MSKGRSSSGKDSIEYGVYGSSRSRHYVVQLITGNPGLIGYYDGFMRILAHRLNVDSKSAFSIQGSSLAGFEISREGPAAPLSLQEQVEAVESQLVDTFKQRSLRSREAGLNEPRFILMSHSVGGYIMLELLRRRNEGSRLRDFPIIGGILLFPTVTYIGRSKQGAILTGLSQIPSFPSIVASFAYVCTVLFTINFLSNIIGLVMGFPPDAAETTARFLKSRIGVEQALHMGADEMRTITEDRWKDDIWGAQDRAAVPLIFHYAKTDRWVHNGSRDELIKLRGRTSDADVQERWKPKMLIAQENIPHAFCIQPEHSKSVAYKAVQWIEELVGLDRQY